MGDSGVLRYGIHVGGDPQAGIQPVVDGHAGDCVHRRYHDRSELRDIAARCPVLQRLLATARVADLHGNLMFDAQIAVVCQEHGIDSILTNDSDFSRFEALQVHRLE